MVDLSVGLSVCSFSLCKKSVKNATCTVRAVERRVHPPMRKKSKQRKSQNKKKNKEKKGKKRSLTFLVKDTQLYKRLCPYVGWLVGPSVCYARVEKWENAHFRPCPPVRNWWPCIRPCFNSERYCITAPAQPSTTGLLGGFA